MAGFVALNPQDMTIQQGNIGDGDTSLKGYVGAVSTDTDTYAAYVKYSSTFNGGGDTGAISVNCYRYGADPTLTDTTLGEQVGPTYLISPDAAGNTLPATFRFIDESPPGAGSYIIVYGQEASDGTTSIGQSSIAAYTF